MIDVSDIPKDEFIRGEMFTNLPKEIPGVIYSKIDHVPYFFSQYARNIAQPFILVSHNGDLAVNDRLLDIAKTIPNLKKWYGQNIECRPDPIIESLPIGLENTYNFPELRKMDRIFEMIQSSKGKSPSRLLYLNFSFSTNSSERESAWRSVKRSCPQLTDKCQQSIRHDEYVSWMTDVIDHHYVLCPRGNGIDTHRLWETLYLGRIPVVKRDTNTRYYEDLPILLINEWSEITENLLVNSIDRLSSAKNFNLHKLKFSWWRDRITKESMRL